ncbi:MAG: MCE family protein [Mycobacteriaceae bacterium]|nr:MCE family protein [Mycobacteriaceae bacterium]
MSNKRLLTGVAIVLAALLVAAGVFVVRQAFFKPKTITAYFTTATAIYPGDEVRVSGVKVGSIATIEPQGTQAKMVMHIDHDVPIPADAQAVIVAQNLVAARYVQLAPAYRSNGPQMKDGAVIPVDRTAVPVEWDQVKEQLMRLSTELGPNTKVSSPAVAHFIDSAADALNGNGDKLRQTIGELSGVGRILADGSGNIADIIKNLQIFVTALRDSNTQIVQFENRLATLTSVIDDNRSDLDAAVSDLSVAVGEVQRFIAGSRDQTSEQIARLADVTQNLVDQRMSIENILHLAPTAFSNFYNIYNPDTGSQVGAPVLNPLLGNPVWFYCGMIGAVENVTGPETAKLCEQYLGPALRLVNINYDPLPTNPFLMPAMSPDRVIYSEPRLAPGGEGPKPGPPEQPPAVSAYTGLPGDYPEAPPPPAPPARIPGISWPAPTQQPVAPPVPGEPSPAPNPSLPDLLLPAERPPS